VIITQLICHFDDKLGLLQSCNNKKARNKAGYEFDTRLSRLELKYKRLL
jgi:hypothetical protein